MLKATAQGAASGFLASTGVGLGAMIAGNAAIGVAGSSIEQTIGYVKGDIDTIDIGDIVIEGAIGAVSGAVGGKGFGSKHVKNMGKNATKRVASAYTNKGYDAAKAECQKASAYYVKSVGKTLREGVVGGIARPAIYCGSAETVYAILSQLRK